MAFRSEEAAMNGLGRARSYLIPRNLSSEDKDRCEETLVKIVDEYGPVVDAYPTWHPLVRNQAASDTVTYPCDRSGYRGLDHTVLFAHAFVTCPYHSNEDVRASVKALPPHPVASLEAEALDIPFYGAGTKPVLVSCDWHRPLEPNLLIPKNLAVPLMIEQELPNWTRSTVAETWETMRPYVLGSPHGNRSSLFVSQDTALAMKTAHLAMINSGMFGPIKVR